ncbi:hypothetical protein J5N97_000579 [Dioscorea zingiberensis]|uniref:Uncharacterized protein n=1 Tax=Dioscorea zingiberensis TaxID=325984 RepID=A0A9D5BRY8_9LILI|nr:hypothetical protein J5N97_000579 [Dioscorea zingiberensis]
MDGKLEISLDKLLSSAWTSSKRTASNDFHRYEEKRESLIRRIDFAWAVEKDDKNNKQKKRSRETSAAQWEFQSMVDNLQLAHQELSVIIDLINTHLGKYFKQSANALEQQMAREARFLWPSPLSTVCVDHDSAGMLAINLPPKSYHSLQFGFLSDYTDDMPIDSSKTKTQSACDADKESVSDDECVKETHSLRREVHQAIFSEQVFDLVNREACNQSLGVTVTGIQENYIQLNIGQETSVFISLVPTSQGEETVDSSSTQNLENAILPLDTLDGLNLPEDKPGYPQEKSQEGAPNVVGLFKGTSQEICSMNRYDCDLADLSVIILQQVASQVIRWLHEEALMVGIKANWDFLCLSFELEQGETLSLVAHVDPEDTEGCISRGGWSWRMVL